MSPKRAKKKAASRRTVKRAATRRRARPAAARKKAAKKKSAKKPARRPAKKAARKTARRRVAKKPARRPALRVVPRPAARPAKAKAAAPKHRPFGGALDGASPKDLALFDLVRARVEVQAAIQGMVAGTADAPVGEGKWSPRQIVLHLHYWDREMLPYVEPAWRENRRPPHTRSDILAENVTSQDELARRDWDEARRLMQQSRESLLEALQSVPDEPAEMWSTEHALGWLIRVLSHHDRHHAAVIKDARTRTGNPS